MVPAHAGVAAPRSWRYLASHWRMHFLQKVWAHGSLTGLLNTPRHTEQRKLQSKVLVKRLRSYPPLCKDRGRIVKAQAPSSAHSRARLGEGRVAQEPLGQAMLSQGHPPPMGAQQWTGKFLARGRRDSHHDWIWVGSCTEGQGLGAGISKLWSADLIVALSGSDQSQLWLTAQ